MSEPTPIYTTGTTPPVWKQTAPDDAGDPYILAVAHAAEEALPELETVIRLFSGPFIPTVVRLVRILQQHAIEPAA